MKNITVGFELSPLKSGHKTRGIGTHTSKLLLELEKSDEIVIRKINNYSETRGVDLIHIPYFDLFKQTLPIFKPIPTIVTIHDVIPLVFPDHYPSGIRGRINLNLQKLSLKNVSAVITISECSKRDIVKYLGVSEKKVYVIPLATSSDYHKIDDQKALTIIRKKLKLPSRFAIYIGNVNWNKNILNLTESAIQSNLDLVLIGKSFEQREYLDHPELKSYKLFLDKYSDHPLVHIYPYLETKDLVRVLNLAEVMIFPSFYEGFGLPVLEAQACGVPVITSDNSSLIEVAGHSAILVDPGNIKNITDEIEKIMNNKNHRRNVIKKGYKNVQRFSWKKTSEMTIEVYQKVIK